MPTAWRRSAPTMPSTASGWLLPKTGKTRGPTARSTPIKMQARHLHFERVVMAFWLGFIGLGLNLTGAVIVALVDAWFSQALLVYLDALESNLAQAVQELQSGGSKFVPTKIDLLRDRSQNRARGLKLIGWCTLSVGFLLQ